MKKILLLVMSCILLVSCTSKKDLIAQYEAEIKVKEEDLLIARKNHKNRIKAYEEALEDLSKEREILKHRQNVLEEAYDLQNQAYSNFQDVLEQAQEDLEVQMMRDQVLYPDYFLEDFRIDELVYLYHEEDLDVAIYQLNYSYKTTDHERFVKDEMIWTQDGYLIPEAEDSHYLLFRGHDYLGHLVNEEAFPESEAFHQALRDYLNKNSKKQVRIDFIDGDHLYSFDMITHKSLELERSGQDGYRLIGDYQGFVKFVNPQDFDIDRHLSEDEDVVEETNIETRLASVQIVDLYLNLTRV